MNTESGSDPYERVIPTLLKLGGDFEASDAFRRLIGYGDDLPGVVACTYAGWVSDQMMADPDADAEYLFRPLNLLADFKDQKVDTMLKDEVLEEFEARGLLGRIDNWMNEALLSIKDAYVPIARR